MTLAWTKPTNSTHIAFFPIGRYEDHNLSPWLNVTAKVKSPQHYKKVSVFIIPLNIKISLELSLAAQLNF